MKNGRRDERKGGKRKSKGEREKMGGCGGREGGRKRKREGRKKNKINFKPKERFGVYGNLPGPTPPFVLPKRKHCL